MKSWVKEELNELIAQVETAIENHHNDGELSDDEYEQLNDARAGFYITLDTIHYYHDFDEKSRRNV